jgi:propionyl-CoA carboxylase alpha chain
MSGQLPGHAARVPEEWVIAVAAERHRLRLEMHASGYLARGEGWELEVATGWRPGDPVLEAQIADQVVAASIESQGPLLRLAHAGHSLEALVAPGHLASALAYVPAKVAPDLSRFLLSPMPGLLVSLAVAEGEEVKAGQELAIVEAMKMENVLRAERDGRIARLHASAGSSLAVDQAILEFE